MAEMESMVTFISQGTISHGVSLQNSHESHDCRFSFAMFLSVAQKFGIDFLPIIWQTALSPFGLGATSRVSNSALNLQTSLAFKRGVFEDKKGDAVSIEEQNKIFQALIAEVLFAGCLGVRNYPNILKLQGICWEISQKNSAVWPVLVYEKAPRNDLKVFFSSEAGKALDRRQRIGLCINIGIALETMHLNHIVHGDIKPENVLVFQDAEKSIYAKVSDFGYMSLFANDDDVLRIPMTQPWVDPEWHPLGHNFKTAVKMDIFSYGLLCVYCLFENELEIQTSEPSNASQYEKICELLFKWKNENILFHHVNKLLENSSDIESSDRSLLQELFRLALTHDRVKRANNIAELIELLSNLNLSGGSLYSSLKSSTHCGSSPQTLGVSEAIEAAKSQHITFSVQDSLLQLARTDYRVRQAIYKYLVEIAASDKCKICCSHAAVEASLCSAIGYGGLEDQERMNRMQFDKGVDLSEISLRIESFKTQAQYIPFKNEWINELDEAGYLAAMDYAHEFRTTTTLVAVETACTKELDQAKTILGDRHVMCYLLKNVLISVIKGTRDTRRAEPLELALVDLLEKDTAFGPEHRLTLSTRNNLAFTYREMNEYQRAEPIFRDVRRRLESLVGSEHPLYLECVANLASLCREQNRLDEAEALFREVLEKREKVFGSDHLKTILAKGSLARVYQNKGNYVECEELTRKVLEVTARVFGETHLHTITLRLNHASVLNMLARYEEAYGIEKKLLDTSTQSLGETHSITLIVKANLAKTLSFLNRWMEAVELGKQTVKDFEKERGLGHVETLTAKLNYTDYLVRLGHIPQAEPILEEVLGVASSNWGDDHYLAEFAKERLTVVWSRQKKWSQAINMAVETLQGRVERQGRTHPRTLESRYVLANLYYEQGDLQTAIAQMQETAELREENPNIGIQDRKMCWRALEVWKREEGKGIDTTRK